MADPPHGIDDESYFKCPPEKALVGGLWYHQGSALWKQFGPADPTCAERDWVRIGKEAFRALAAEWHGVDWSAETPFWSEQVRDNLESSGTGFAKRRLAFSRRLASLRDPA